MLKIALIISGIIIFQSAASQDTLLIKKASSPIVFDGIPNEQAWSEVDSLPMTMYTPVFGKAPSEKSIIKIAHDGQFLYASGILYDSEPDKIQGNTMVRDRNPSGDFFNVLIDTYNDNETVWNFSTMPSGNRLDVEISNDAEGSQAFNPDWNTYWDVKTAMLHFAWSVEMRIPFTSLRFKGNSSEVVLGLIVHRVIGRKFERQIFPAIPPNWAFGGWKASQAKKIKLRDVNTKRATYAIPYFLTGYTAQEYKLAPGKGSFYDKKWNTVAGGDIKLGLSTNYNLDVTLNTDFAQVEADNFQTNLTRFSLFFPEKRQFFQERSSLFNFSLSGVNRLFHSRLIGLDPAGQPLQVYGGVRLTGRSKGFDIGFLDMVSAAPIDSLGPTNFSVLRLKQRFFNRNSYFGAILTSNADQAQHANVTYGLDFVFRPYAQNFLIIKGGQSFSSQGTNARNSFLNASWTKRATAGLGYSLGFESIDDNFNPGIGFIQRKNTFLTGNVSYGVFKKTHEWVRSITPSFAQRTYLRNGDGTLETSGTDAKLELTTLGGQYFGLTSQWNYDEVTIPFSPAPDLTIQPDHYSFYRLIFEWNTNQGKRFRVNTIGDFGTYYGNQQSVVSVSPAWNINKYFEFSVSYRVNRIVTPVETVNADLASVNAIMAVDTHWSISTLAQYNNLTERFGLNCRIRYNRSEGNDFYLVYNSSDFTGYRGERLGEGTPIDNFSLRLKYTHVLMW